ncbi:phosphotransferase system PTS, lactose/cellobiose-specific IIA subunit [Alkaliphilus metalliredigens QYMF]|uniref:Phosphotransferase system PTS, lactose/cellobiose-specific IIA subunit n=1 Tax=Alkaliphilus metalliredigens (strain QYMF) TaxID=293826 RepID=A6TVQ5_ALKMQ|nr:PTS lactose/cellobiose transporter subunit IIA [Alkaliphilus metalliredigens]ABR50273.1 phosphotransferase system PTS, lactose/cellobiose-specific IIA subunit [Alkaliphilus metalliredigens QYMF]
MDIEVAIFTLITHSGEARSSSMESIQHAKKGDFKKAIACIEDAKAKLILAHQAQTTLIHAEAQGNKVEISLLMIHAQDHLMNAMTIKDMAEEFVDLYKNVLPEKWEA